jgi:hypothetical protein
MKQSSAAQYTPFRTDAESVHFVLLRYTQLRSPLRGIEMNDKADRRCNPEPCAEFGGVGYRPATQPLVYNLITGNN